MFLERFAPQHVDGTESTLLTGDAASAVATSTVAGSGPEDGSPISPACTMPPNGDFSDGLTPRGEVQYERSDVEIVEGFDLGLHSRSAALQGNVVPPWPFSNRIRRAPMSQVTAQCADLSQRREQIGGFTIRKWRWWGEWPEP